jgi:hypothetical protein
VGNLLVALAIVGHTNMVAETSTCRDDERLGSTRCQTAIAIKNNVLCSVVSLWRTIEKATQFTAYGQEVIALMCKGRSDIIALPDQAWKLTKPQVFQRTNFYIVMVKTADGCHRPLIPNGALCREVTVSNAMLRT